MEYAMDASNSNELTRAYLDSIRIETRYLDGDVPDLSYYFCAQWFASPIMTAALSHLDRFMYPGAMAQYAEGAARANAVLWIGMTTDEEAARCAATGAKIVEIIKPYNDRDKILQRMRKAEELGFLAVGIDIDHSFGDDGEYDAVAGEAMCPLTSAELKEFCDASKLPLIVKGVLSEQDLRRAVEAGAAGAVLSHHNNRIGYALPPLQFLRELDPALRGRIPLYVDCEIAGGADAFKCLALGANGVGVGRPLMAALKNGGAAGVADWFRKASAELRKYMACTGCRDLVHLDPTVLHF